jgi:hypothetical protein
VNRLERIKKLRGNDPVVDLGAVEQKRLNLRLLLPHITSVPRFPDFRTNRKNAATGRYLCYVFD